MDYTYDDNDLFLEHKTPDDYSLAIVRLGKDVNNILARKFIGKIVVPINSSDEDDAKIFEVLSQAIDADNIYVDLEDHNSFTCLNTWSIKHNPLYQNLFMDVRLLTIDEKKQLYNERHSITMDHQLKANDLSLALIDFSHQQKWKTGVLQECIDRLVKPEFRSLPNVYVVLDENYRKIMRFKVESYEYPTKFSEHQMLKDIQNLTKILGIKNTRDDSSFITIDQKSHDEINHITQKWSLPNTNPIENLCKIFQFWSGTSIKKVPHNIENIENIENRENREKYKLFLDEKVTEGLSYLKERLISLEY